MLSGADFCPESSRQQAIAQRVRVGFKNSQRGAAGFGAEPQYYEGRLHGAVWFNVPFASGGFCPCCSDKEPNQVSIQLAAKDLI